MERQTSTTAVELLSKRPQGLLRAGSLLRRWPILPLLVIVSLSFMAVFAPLISPHDPLQQNLRGSPHPPVWYAEGTTKFLLGSDGVGRDVLSRVMHGARISLMVASFSLASGFLFGTSIGIVSGYFGGLLDEVVMRIVDIWAAVPFLVFALVVVIVFGAGIGTLMGLLVLLAWSSFVRNVRAEVLSLKERDYVALAKVAGAGPIRIMARHILPGVINTAIVIATLRLGGLILAAAALSFLGAGIPAPTPSWGGMVADGRDFLATAWWISFFPGVSIFLLVMSLNFLGDWMRDRFDPRLRQL